MRPKDAREKRHKAKKKKKKRRKKGNQLKVDFIAMISLDTLFPNYA